MLPIFQYRLLAIRKDILFYNSSDMKTNLANNLLGFLLVSYLPLLVVSTPKHVASGQIEVDICCKCIYKRSSDVKIMKFVYSIKSYILTY